MMERDYNVFYCTICHVCKKIPMESVAMKVCSGCRLVQYCSYSHQQRDWSNHKEFCKAIQQIMKRTGSNHLFEEACEFIKDDLSSWNKLQASVIKLVEMVMKRSLIPTESQMLLLPLVCHYCFGYKVKHMFPCSICNSVLYCSVKHMKKDKTHTKYCQRLGLSLTLDLSRFCEQNSLLNLSLYINELGVLKELGLPQNMECLPKCRLEKSVNDFFRFSEILSYTLTLTFAIQKVCKLSPTKLIIHIVGADAMEILAVNTLILFFYLCPHLSNLKIIMIGPNIPKVPAVIMENCEVDNVNKLYHEYVASECYIHPDVIAVFNCGFSEHVDQLEKDIWKLSLPCIANVKNSIVLLTSYTNHEAKIDLKRLSEMRNKQYTFDNVLECQLNPFSSLYPHRDWENYGGVFYVNNYISVLKM